MPTVLARLIDYGTASWAEYAGRGQSSQAAGLKRIPGGETPEKDADQEASDAS